ncbi:hypothetical protein [Thalassotalea sediminis]|uniref:hypothetical protein n=1 Tax=Thalassotalea sediminis TaxID=1759089 RepID=UPI0025737FBD|nr:hypothetical protein [Thalassotalea sediminis]
MRKQNSIIFGGLLSIMLLSSCGMPGPLYQESDEKKTKEHATVERPAEKQEQE